MSKHKAKIEITLHLNYPARALGRRNLREYVVAAVESWQKGGDPESVWFDAVERVTTGACEVIER